MKNKKVVWIVIGIVSVALIALAITYAYWQITASQQGVNEISAACLDISLVDAESGNTGVTLQDQFPLSDTEGATLKPYKFTVTNNCDVSVDYQIALESIGDSTSALKASSLKVMLDSTTSLLNANETVTPTIDGAYASHKLGMGTLAASGNTGSSVTHELRLWIDEAAPVSENNKTYNGKITVTIGQGISNFVPLKDTLLAAYGGEAAITELDSSAFGTSASEAGMYKAQDDYGTSYYYRGNVTNNYVKFGKALSEVRLHYLEEGVDTYDTLYSLNECNQLLEEDPETFIHCEEIIKPAYWRIIRINGDGTIRLIYAGTNKYSNGEEIPEADGNLDLLSMYNENDDHKKYVGYMYGTDEDPYGDNPNTILTDSTLKTNVDNWYNRYLKDDYESYIADSIFCNDREEYQENEDGYITYKNYNRVEMTYEPVLTCSNQRDRFTVDDTILGNGRLTNPVGLITADEAMMTRYQISHSGGSWTISPAGSDLVYYFMTNDTEGILVNNESLFLPVINLKSDVEYTIDDDGTYVITTN